MKVQMPENQIIRSDCVEGMKMLPPRCIPLTVTSPPYEGLRTYDGHAAWNFLAVARELFRVTMPGGVVVWVVQE
jgi:DNA modification methylase